MEKLAAYYLQAFTDLEALRYKSNVNKTSQINFYLLSQLEGIFY